MCGRWEMAASTRSCLCNIHQHHLAAGDFPHPCHASPGHRDRFRGRGQDAAPVLVKGGEGCVHPGLLGPCDGVAADEKGPGRHERFTGGNDLLLDAPAVGDHGAGRKVRGDPGHHGGYGADRGGQEDHVGALYPFAGVVGIAVDDAQFHRPPEIRCPAADADDLAHFPLRPKSLGQRPADQTDTYYCQPLDQRHERLGLMANGLTEDFPSPLPFAIRRYCLFRPRIRAEDLDKLAALAQFLHRLGHVGIRDMADQVEKEDVFPGLFLDGAATRSCRG